MLIENKLPKLQNIIVLRTFAIIAVSSPISLLLSLVRSLELV